MKAFDALSLVFRSLANEYGVGIVVAMRNDGYRDPRQLEELLRIRRERGQDQALKLDISTEVKAGFMRAAARRDREMDRSIFETIRE